MIQTLHDKLYVNGHLTLRILRVRSMFKPCRSTRTRWFKDYMLIKFNTDLFYYYHVWKV